MFQSVKAVEAILPNGDPLGLYRHTAGLHKTMNETVTYVWSHMPGLASNKVTGSCNSSSHYYLKRPQIVF